MASSRIEVNVTKNYAGEVDGLYQHCSDERIARDARLALEFAPSDSNKNVHTWVL